MNIAEEAKAIEARVWSEYHLDPRYDGANGALLMVYNSPGDGQKTVKLWLWDRKPLGEALNSENAGEQERKPEENKKGD